MKKITIKIIAPNKKDSWRITIGSGQKKKTDAVATFKAVERHLQSKQFTFLASDSVIKINLIVDNSAIHNEPKNSWINNGNYARKNEVLCALACFLEDYLPKRYFKQKHKIYGGD